MDGSFELETMIDEINFQIREGKEPLTAIMDSGVSRMRPVSMAALTTVLGVREFDHSSTQPPADPDRQV